MEDNKSMSERNLKEVIESTLEKSGICNDLDQRKSISEEELKGSAAIAEGPGNLEGITQVAKGYRTIVSFERIIKDFPNYQNEEGKFKLLNTDKYHLEKVDDSIQLFEDGVLSGVMYEGDELHLDFGNDTAKVINKLVENKVYLTLGQKAVGLTFNPSGDPKVIQAKQLIADAIDLLEEVHQEKTNNGAASSTWFRNVFRTESFNQLVNASSSLVKYLTWQD